MIEVDRRGVPHQVSGLDEETALELLSESVTAERQLGRGRLRLTLRLARLDPLAPEDASVWARWDAAGQGASLPVADRVRPEVSGSCDAEVGAALGTSTKSAENWVADALEIQFRLPLHHARLERLEADVWKVRQVARQTRSMSAEAAAFVDAELAGRIDRIGMVTIGRALALAIAIFHPERLEEHDAEAKSGWHVKVSHPQPVDYAGTSFLDASADSIDLDDFIRGLRQIAAELAEAGDTDPLPQRLAKALGVMGRRTVEPLTAADPDRPRDRRGRRRLEVFVRLSESVVLGEVPRLGVVGESVLERWLCQHGARVSRIIDLARDEALDAHDPPAWLRALVEARDGHCVFPACTRVASECDLDHIEPYVEGGPPGQTSAQNLACLCRRHHLFKTHAGWRYRRDESGCYVWTSPHGLVLLVEPDGTDHLIGRVA